MTIVAELRDVHTAIRNFCRRLEADSLQVLTTGRLFCSRCADALPAHIVPCPVPMPALKYYHCCHDKTHRSVACRWLRERVRQVATRLRGS